MAEITLMKTPAETKLGEQFETVRSAQPKLAEARGQAFAAFADKGLPHRRLESWHYTDLRSLLRDALPPAAAPDVTAIAKAKSWLDAHSTEGARAVLVDGTFVAELSSSKTDGVTIASTLDILGQGASSETKLLAAEKLGTGESILALNAAFLQGGAVISIDAKVETPIEFVSFVSGAAPAAITTRSLVHVANEASAIVRERHVALGSAADQGNHALVLALDEGAELDHVAEIEGFPASALHIGSMLARLAGKARLASFALTATPGIARRQTFVEFVGEHSSIALRGVTLLEGEAHADTTLVVTHTAPHCESREYFKTILDGESTGIYQGKVVVAPHAQKTDGKMMSRAIFLGEGANMYNKPELEIFADDVVCGHGATVGYLDEDQLFYLRARGIPLKEAQALLLNAFAADAIEEVATETIQEDLLGSVERWLGRRHA